MQKILALICSLSVTASPVWGWGEGGCNFSKNNNSSQDSTIEQVEDSDSSYK
tara:strand:+ start:187 stop:342 length:156 start_codon:yes stop_codon:yes gene_type:complete